MKRWIGAGVAAVVMGILVAMLMRWQASRPVADEVVAAALPRVNVEAELTADGLDPYRIQVPRDRDVHLLVRATRQAPEGALTLLGYEDQISPVYLGPGQGREIVFRSTRPGDDFGFSLGDKVVGRLEVTGDHLEKGHQ